MPVFCSALPSSASYGSDEEIRAIVSRHDSMTINEDERDIDATDLDQVHPDMSMKLKILRVSVFYLLPI